jgi:hypothetical protein
MVRRQAEVNSDLKFFFTLAMLEPSLLFPATNSGIKACRNKDLEAVCDLLLNVKSTSVRENSDGSVGRANAKAGRRPAPQ